MSIALIQRQLGNTDLRLTRLGFGASSIGAEFGQFDLESSLSAVRTALDAGINFVDTAAYYGRGMSEILLGQILPSYPREKLVVSTKLGRYAPRHFDFSAKRVSESVEVSLERMRLDYLDIVFCHDVEYGDIDQVVEETLPALRRQVELGKVRYVGVSGYPMRNFERIIPTGLIDCFITYNHYTLQNDMAAGLLPLAERHRVGAINAAPFSARLLTNLPLPSWHKATPDVRRIAGDAALYCSERGSSIEKLALQFSIHHPGFTSCLVGSAVAAEISQWMAWLDEPIDQNLLSEVQTILKPIHNWYYIEGRPENNDLSWPSSVLPSSG